ncbi:hybrid sensor histidine kinase/response regulator [Flavobacterium branchiophilum]
MYKIILNHNLLFNSNMLRDFLLNNYLVQLKVVLTSRVRNTQMLGLRYSFILGILAFVFSVFWFSVDAPILAACNLTCSISFFITSLFIVQNKYADLCNHILLYIGLATIFITISSSFHVYPYLAVWYIGPVIFAHMFLKRFQGLIVFFINLALAIISPYVNVYVKKHNLLDQSKVHYSVFMHTLIIVSILAIVYFILEQYKEYKADDEFALFQKNQELDDSRKELIKTQKYKEEFFALISHEIRTPMNAIIGISNIVRKTNLDTNQIKFIEAIQSSANNLLVIINDLLDLSKLEAGKLRIENKGFNLNNSLQFIFSLFANKAEDKGLEFNISFDNRIASILVGDQIRINQILLNLTSNAIKFTENGYVEIKCELIGETNNSQKIKFSIIDSGIGISEAFLKNIFDQFSQEDLSTSRKFGGTGLGMTISKHLVDMMNGDIKVSSLKNVGTTIEFVLKLAIGTDKDLPISKEIQMENDVLKGKTILLVEDNEMNRLVAQNTLELYGAIVKEVFNGQEAVDFLKINTVDLILMDIGMPVMNGIKATEIIRSELKITTPIIALTANALAEERNRCIIVGMNDFLTKPFKEGHLIQVISNNLNNKITIFEDIKEEIFDSNEIYTLANIKMMSKNNDSFEKSMVQIFLKESKKAMSEISIALEQEDWEKLRFFAHKIKASVKMLEIKKAIEIVLELEKYDPAKMPDFNIAQQTKSFFLYIDKVNQSLEEHYPN